MREVLVGARLDRGSPTLTSQDLDEYCRIHDIVGGYVGTSAQTDAGLDDLLQRIRAILDWERMPATVTTATFKRVKDFLLALKADPERPGVLVAASELRALLQQSDSTWNFTDADMLAAAQNLASHGYVAVLRATDGGAHVLLVPELLANLASSIVIEARRHPRGLGAIDERALLAGELRFPELAGLPDDHARVLLDAVAALFLGHHLCFRQSVGRDTVLVFPSLINLRRPADGDPNLVDDVTYRVRGRVENLYASLVVQLGYTSNFIGTRQWKDQVRYRARYVLSDQALCGFRQHAEREGEIELVLEYGPDAPVAARRLFEGLVETFLRQHDISVSRYTRAVCKGCARPVERVLVVKRIEEALGFVFCPDCGQKVPLPNAAEAVALSQEEHARVSEARARAGRKTTYEQALVAVKSLVGATPSPTAFLSYAWGDPTHEEWVAQLAEELSNAGIDTTLDQRDNAGFGRNVARFVERISPSRWIIVVGTPAYQAKHQNRVSTAGSIVAAEMDLVNQRLTGTEADKESVIPLLVSGTAKTALPPLLQGRTWGDFTGELRYFVVLFDLVLTLHGIDFSQPAIKHWRAKLNRDADPSSMATIA